MPRPLLAVLVLATVVWCLADGVPAWVVTLGMWWVGLALIAVAVACVVGLGLIVDGWSRGELEVVVPSRRPCSGHVQRADTFARRRDAVVSGRAR